MSDKKKQKTNNKMFVALIVLAIVLISTLAWHGIRVEKREAAAEAQSIYFED
jgi:hypothetical protein